MSIDALITRLSRVRPTGQGRFIACCPAHSDKTPSLAVRELEDGRILVHCFAGCSAQKVLDAIHLSFYDLVPERLGDRKRERKPFYSSDVLEILKTEARLVLFCARDVFRGKALSQSELSRLALAVQRIAYAIGV